MNLTQRNNIAKYCYDVSKGILLLTVVNPFITHKIIIIDLITGMFTSGIFFILGYFLNREDE